MRVPGQALWLTLAARTLGGQREPGWEAGHLLRGQGQRWAAKQDQAGGIPDSAGSVDRRGHVGGVDLGVESGIQT